MRYTVPRHLQVLFAAFAILFSVAITGQHLFPISHFQKPCAARYGICSAPSVVIHR